MNRYCEAKGCKHLARRTLKWCQPCYKKQMRAAGESVGRCYGVLFAQQMTKCMREALKRPTPEWMKPPAEWSGGYYTIPINLDDYR